MKNTTVNPVIHFTMSKKNENSILIQRAVLSNTKTKHKAIRSSIKKKKIIQTGGKHCIADKSPKVVLYLFDEDYVRELQGISQSIGYPKKNNDVKEKFIRIIKQTLLR